MQELAYSSLSNASGSPSPSLRPAPCLLIKAQSSQKQYVPHWNFDRLQRTSKETTLATHGKELNLKVKRRVTHQAPAHHVSTPRVPMLPKYLNT